jgi:hypothetical protein
MHAAAQKSGPPIRSPLVLGGVAGLIERLFQLPAGGLGGFPEIRARLLHEASQRERGKPKTFGVELNNRLAEPVALMQRLRYHWSVRFSAQFVAQSVEECNQRGFVRSCHKENGKC